MVEIKRVAEEERVARVQEILGLVMDEPVDAEKLARGAIFAYPAGAHLKGSIAAARGKGVAAVVDHDHGPVDAVLIGNGEGVFIDFQTELGRETQQMGRHVSFFGPIRGTSRRCWFGGRGTDAIAGFAVEVVGVRDAALVPVVGIGTARPGLEYDGHFFRYKYDNSVPAEQNNDQKIKYAETSTPKVGALRVI